MSIALDYSLAFHGGLSEDELLAEGEAMQRALSRFLARVTPDAQGQRELGFWTLPTEDHAAQAAALAAQIPETVEEVLVLGIGGSSLGGRAIYEALCGPPELREGRRLHFPDNSDPWRLARLLKRLDPAKTLAIVISKSGGTAETAAMLLVVQGWLTSAGCPLSAHVIAITDPAQGELRAWAQKEALHTLPIPSDVGGRFSVLTGVGLLPAALVGVDIAQLCAGAEAMRLRCEQTALRENPAMILAALHGLHLGRGKQINVLMPYADCLRASAAWFVQLWAESLGKRRDRQGAIVEQGSTPIAAIGATDQHAQVQLFMDGPRDKVVWFIDVNKTDMDITIPSAEGANAYLEGVTFSALLRAQRRATALALAHNDRPSLTITLDQIDAWHLGGLFFLLEAATALRGEADGIDAFDQPGVELGKRLTCGVLGRRGYEEEAARVAKSEAEIPTRRA